MGWRAQTSVHFEKAAILFNIGAVTSQLAVATDRTTDAGVKEASRLFQVPPDVLHLVSSCSLCLHGVLLVLMKLSHSCMRVCLT